MGVGIGGDGFEGLEIVGDRCGGVCGRGRVCFERCCGVCGRGWRGDEGRGGCKCVSCDMLWI